MGKKELNISGIIAIVLGSMMTVSLVLGVFGIISLIGGILFVKYSRLNDENFLKKKDAILIWSIVLIFANFIASIFSFIALDKLSSDVKSKKVLDVDPDMKKLNIILMIGTGMVTISALIFATTNREILGGIFNTILLLVLGFGFIFLSNFVKEKIKITSTVVSYFVLGLLFLLFSFIAISSFEVFGSWFSLNGAGKYLYSSILCYIGALLIWVAYKRFNKEYLLYFGGILKLSMLAYLIVFFNLRDFLWLILLLVTGFGLFLNDKGNTYIKVYYNLSKITFLITSSLVFINNFILSAGDIYSITFTNKIVSIISVLFIFIFYFYNYHRNKNILSKIAFPLSNIISIVSVIGLFNLLGSINIIILTILGLFTYGIGVLLGDKKLLFISSIISNSFLFFVFIFSFNYFYTPLIVTSVLLFINLFSLYSLSTNKYEVWLQPIKLVFLISSIVHFISLVNYKFMIIYILSSVIFICMYLLNKNKTIRAVYLFTGLVALLLSNFLTNVDDFAILFRLCILVINVSYVYILRNSIDKVFIIAKELSYLLLYVVIYAVLDCVSMNFASNMVSYILLLSSYLGLLLIYNKNKLYNMIGSLVLVIPLFSLVNTIGFSFEFDLIFNSLILLYGLYIINRLFINNMRVRNILYTIGISLIYLPILFNGSIVVVIFIAISALIFIFIGYYNKYYNYLYTLGIFITIFNLLVSLGNLWDSISIWIYLLIFGLGIMVFGTYKLMRLDKNKILDKQDDALVLAFRLDGILLLKSILYSGLIIILVLMV